MAAVDRPRLCLRALCFPRVGANKLREPRARLFSFIQDKKSIIGVGRAWCTSHRQSSPSRGRKRDAAAAAAEDGSRRADMKRTAERALGQFLFTGKSTLSSLL